MRLRTQEFMVELADVLDRPLQQVRLEDFASIHFRGTAAANEHARFAKANHFKRHHHAIACAGQREIDAGRHGVGDLRGAARAAPRKCEALEMRASRPRSQPASSLHGAA